MWFLIVVVVNLQGEVNIDLLQTGGKVDCYSKLAKTVRVLNHQQSAIKAFQLECKQAQNT